MKLAAAFCVLALASVSVTSAAKPSPFGFWYDLGLQPSGNYAGEEDFGPCLGEDNEWRRGWRGDIDGFVWFTIPAFDFCQHGKIGFAVRVEAPQKYNVSVYAQGGTFTQPVYGIMGPDQERGRNVYQRCWFSGLTEFYREYPYTVHIQGPVKDAYLEVLIVPDTPNNRATMCDERQ